jgi:hypothetical protein
MAFGGAGILPLLPVTGRVTSLLDNPIHLTKRLGNLLSNIFDKFHPIINNIFERIFSFHQLLNCNLIHINLLF